MNKPLLSVAGVGVIGTFAIVNLLPVPAEATPRHAVSVPSTVMDSVVLHVEGMTCGGCAISTRIVLERLPGVKNATVDYAERRAVVTYDPARVSVQQMIAAIKTLGYTATLLPEKQR